MDRQIALYWDFENIHASVGSIENGSEWYRKNRFGKQPNVVNIDAIMQYVAGIGDVNINKAYSNWGFLHAYSADLQNHAVDLIQLFPRGGHAKNGADIRLAIDVIEDISLHPHICTVVVIGGDSDYIAVAQRVRQKGRSIIGIGAKETTNQYWIKSCNEFKFYSSLLVKSATVSDIEDKGYEGSDLDDAKELLRSAVLRIVKETGDQFARKAAVKPMMVRLDPSFDESNYNFGSFSELLEACNDVIAISRGEHDHHIMLVELGPAVPTDERIESEPYEQLLKKQQIRLVPSSLMTSALKESFEVFSENGAVASFSEFKDQLSDRLRERQIAFAEADLSKIKTLLYKSRCFEVDQVNRVIRLPSTVDSADELRRRVLQELVSRVASNVEEVDSAILARILLGDSNNSSLIEQLVSEYRSAQESTVADTRSSFAE